MPSAKSQVPRGGKAAILPSPVHRGHFPYFDSLLTVYKLYLMLGKGDIVSLVDEVAKTVQNQRLTSDSYAETVLPHPSVAEGISATDTFPVYRLSLI